MVQPSVILALFPPPPVAWAEDTCLRNQYRCSNGNCINSIWWCDFDNDCGDMSDEKNCRESAASAQLAARLALAVTQEPAARLWPPSLVLLI